MDRDRPFNRVQALTMVKATGAIKAEVAFSGGNDEGGVDNIHLHFSETDIREIELTEDETYDIEQKKYISTGELTERQKVENSLWNMLCKPVYDRYGSFAGEFYVTGTIWYDTGTWTVVMNAPVQTYESIEIDDGPIAL